MTSCSHYLPLIKGQLVKQQFILNKDAFLYCTKEYFTQLTYGKKYCTIIILLFNTAIINYMTMSENIMQKKLSHVKDFLCNMGMLELWGKTKNTTYI